MHPACPPLPRTRPWHRPASLLLLVLGPVLGGCPEPHIVRFITRPEVICPGDEVVLSWVTQGSAHLSATPEVPGLGHKASVGQQTVTLQGPTRLRLEATRFLAGSEATEHEVLSPPRELEYGLDDSRGQHPFTCSAQTGALEASLSLEAAHLSPSVRLGQFVNMNARSLVVTKGEKTETVDAGGKARGLLGEPARGTWRLRVPLQPGEGCEDALESISGRLILKLQLTCPR